MHDSHTTTLDPLPDVTTLDGDRADRFGTFLAVEAAADTASARSSVRSPRRRIAIGVAAASALAAGILAVTSVVGAPGSGPEPVDAAVSIEQADGWTTISISDPGATPAEIEAALDAVGIDARVEQRPGSGVHFEPLPGAAVPSHEGTVEFYGASIVASGDDDHRAFYSVESFADAAPGELAGMSLDFAFDGTIAWSVGSTFEAITPEPGQKLPQVDAAPFEQAMDELGIRVGGDLPPGTVSIKDGADVKVVLSTR